MADAEQPVDSTASAEERTALLTSKIAQASQLYAHKAYEQAAEIYAEAAELQAELNGEMAIENADLLYAYGRCLYHVAVANSDVLGGKVAGEKADPSQDSSKPRGTKRKKAGDDGSKAADAAGTASAQVPSTDSQPQKSTDVNGDSDSSKKDPLSTNAPYFQIEGDDPDWGSDSDEEDADATADDQAPEGGDPGTAAEEEDDFATAYEILDVARVLLSRKLEAAQASPGASPSDPVIRTIKESLADTHDLQSEISLESERFPTAVTDSRASLALKQDLYPADSNYVAEAHFKLSLALEFASVTQVKDDEVAESATADRNTGVANVDEELRAEAATHMEASIASTKLRLEKEKSNLADLMHQQPEATSGSDAEEKLNQDRQQKEKDIADVESMIEEMEQRLVDLRQPAVSLNDTNAADDGTGDAVRGLLGSLLGESKDVRDARIEEATKGANDLSGLVKKKNKSASNSTEPAVANGNGNGNGKRKAVDGADDAGTNGQSVTAKRARVEDVPEEA